ncbi:MAG: extracellular solute-binding protein [Planctomycetes bacterium]|nr:extracellular solute-binding protein [Planctomycetota bacterium]
MADRVAKSSPREPDSRDGVARRLMRWPRFVRTAFLASASALAALAFSGCAEERSREVVVYCALDLEYADAILRDFTAATGIEVRLHADDEIFKTVGLTRKIQLEREHPKADVFWNNEIVNTIRLKNLSCLEAYASPSAADIPPQFKDPAGYWTGFAARARVFIVNKERCPAGQEPRSFRDYLDPARKGQWAIAKPTAGTTASHLAVLFHTLGDDAAKEWWQGLRRNGSALLTGNGHVMKSVRAGEFAYGFTDTDDFRVAETDGYPVACIYPDQGAGEAGCLVIPNTISLVKGGPHPDFGRQFIDYVLSRETERKLAHGPSAQIPVRADIEAPPWVVRLAALKVMPVDYEQAATEFDAAQEWLTTPGVLTGATETAPAGG